MGIFPGGPIFNTARNVLHALLAMRHFHEPAGYNDFEDPAGWNRASYSAHPIDSIEPLPDEPNGYRQAAVYYLGIMFAVDQFLETAPDVRLAVVAVAVVLGWPSARGLSVGNIADQLGRTPAALTRSIARFKTMAGSIPPAAFGQCRIKRRQADFDSSVVRTGAMRSKSVLSFCLDLSRKFKLSRRNNHLSEP